MKERFAYLRSLFSQTYAEWDKHSAPSLGAALAYYTVLSLAPLLVIAVSIAGQWVNAISIASAGRTSSQASAASRLVVTRV